MRLLRRKPRWQDHWTIETFTAADVSKEAREEGATGYWGWDIAWTNWENLQATSEIAVNLGDPDLAPFFNVNNDPNFRARLLYGSRLGIPGDATQRWWPTEKAAREVAEKMAAALWHDLGYDR